MNFNIGKETNKINNTNSEIKTTTEKSNNSDAKKKMIKFMGIFVGGFLIILLIIFIASIFIKREYSYEEIEEVLVTAAESYFEDHKESLPSEEGKIVEIDVANLVDGEYMKDLSEYTKEGVSCSATVQVESVDSEYLYTPFLNCGDDNYVTKELYQEITSEDKIVTSGYGLYNQNGTYVYRGENVNNYVELDKALWRIVKITPNNSMVLIKDESIGEQLSWDDRYNEQEDYETGINNYSASRIKDELVKLYKEKPEDEEYEFLSANDKKKIISHTLCIGKRGEQEIGTDNTIECSEVLENQKISLLTVSDFLNASIDANCTTASSRSCQNYNYLVTSYKWWLATANKSNTKDVYSINNSGTVSIDEASNYAFIRPVIHLNGNILYKSGNGTAEKPYKLK